MERDPASLQKFKEILAKRESSNDYRAKNSLGYLGKYQFGGYALIDTGYKDRKGNWTGKDGIKSEEDFLNSPEVQEKAMDKHVELNRRYLKNKGATEYIGKEFKGNPVTESGLVGAAHLVGAGGVSKMLKTGKVPKDAFGTEATEYLDLLNNISLEDERKMDKLKKLEGLKKELNSLGIAPEMQERVGKEFNEGGLMTEEEILKAQVNPTPEQARYLNRAQQIEGELAQSEPNMSSEPEAPKELTGIEKLIEDYRKEKEAFKSRLSTADNMSALSSIASTFDKYSPNSVGLQAQQFDAGMAPSLNETINLAKLKGLGSETPLTEYQKQALDLRKKELEAKGKDREFLKEERKANRKLKGGDLTLAQKKIDENYADDYNQFTEKGKNNAENSIRKLESYADRLDAESDRMISRGGGSFVASLPDMFRSEAAIEYKNQIVTAANATLKELFGGNLSDGERESAAAEFYDDALGPVANARILKEKIKDLKVNLDTKMEKAKFYENKGTLQGWKGTDSGRKNNKEQKVLSKKFYSKKSNKTKLVYSDGSEEIVDGRQ